MRRAFVYTRRDDAVEGDMKVTQKTFIELNGLSVRLGDLRQALLDHPDDTVIKFSVQSAGGIADWLTMEIQP